MTRCGQPLGYVLDELPLAQGWALIAWHIENDPWLPAERASAGYLAQEPTDL